MKRLIGFTAALCLLALMVGCGGATSSGTLAYVSNSMGSGFTVFTVNTNGTLTTSGISPVNTAAPKVLVFSPNGKWAFFLDADGQNIYAYARAGNGSFSTKIDTQNVSGNASSLVVDPASNFLYVALQNSQQLATYSIEQSTGLLFNISGSPQNIGYGISQLIMPKGGGVLYGLAPAKQAVVSFTLTAGSGAAAAQNSFPVGPTPPPDGMILSADGSYLYVLDTTATGDYNNVATGLLGQSPNIYAFTTSANGILTTMPGSPFHENADLITELFPAVPWAGVTSNDSRYLFVANQGSHNISVFQIEGTSIPGVLPGEPVEVRGQVTTVNNVQVSTASPFDCGFLNAGPSCSTPAFLAVPKANNALYVLDTNASSIFQFAVDQNTGRLRALSPASVSLGLGATPTWITLR